MIHCSGGGQTKILHFIENMHVIKDAMFPVPPLFQIIREQSGTSLKEMYQVYNMGHRFEMYVPPSITGEILRISESFNIEARIIGRCEKWEGKKLTIRNEQESFSY